MKAFRLNPYPKRIIHVILVTPIVTEPLVVQLRKQALKIAEIGVSNFG